MHGRLSEYEQQQSPLLMDLQRSHSDMADRFGAFETGFGDTSNKHAQDLAAVRELQEQHGEQIGKHGSHLDTFHMHQKEHATLPERIEYLEQQIGDSADRHAAAVEELHQKLAGEQAARDEHHSSFRNLLSRESDERGTHHATVNERLDNLERTFGDSDDKHSHNFARVASNHEGLAGDLQANVEQQGEVLRRMTVLEERLVETAERHARELRGHHSRLAIIKDAWSQETPRD